MGDRLALLVIVAGGPVFALLLGDYAQIIEHRAFQAPIAQRLRQGQGPLQVCCCPGVITLARVKRAQVVQRVHLATRITALLGQRQAAGQLLPSGFDPA